MTQVRIRDAKNIWEPCQREAAFLLVLLLCANSQEAEPTVQTDVAERELQEPPRDPACIPVSSGEEPPARNVKSLNKEGIRSHTGASNRRSVLHGGMLSAA